MARVIFFNRFYWPDEPATAQLLVDLAESLAAAGHEVAIVASRPRAIPPTESRNGVTIRRVASTRLPRWGMLGRAIDLLSFYPGALWRLVRVVRPGDTLVAMTDPPLAGVLAWLVAAIRSAKLMHWTQDIYPEIAAEVARQRWLLAARPVRNLSWRRASACVAPGPAMAKVIRRAGVPAEKISVSANWAPAGLAPASPSSIAALRAAWGLEGKFVIGYSGNLGRVHHLEPLVEVAATLRDDPAFAFVIIGHGAQRGALADAVRERGLSNVRFHPPQPRGSLGTTLGVADIHLVTLKPGAEHYVFPSKLYGIAKVGRPVLFIGPPDSDLAGILAAAEFGASFSGDAPQPIADWLRKIHLDPAAQQRMREAALRFEPRGRENAVAHWHHLLGGSLAAPPRPRHNHVR